MMWAGGTLLAYAVTLGTAGAIGLRGARWTVNAPKLGVLAWQILSLSVLASVAFAGLLMLNPASGTHADVRGLSWSAQMLAEGHFSHAAPAMWCGAMILLAAGVMTSTARGVLLALLQSRRERVRHANQLVLLGTPHGATGAVVLEHHVAAAYCLPGPHPAVVVTTAALAALDDGELAAVLAHERAHLRGRHHLALALSEGLRRALWFVPLFRWAHHEQARLLEMIADDAAARTASRRKVATAMVQMAQSSVPSPALGAGGTHSAARVDRMLAPSTPIRRWQAALIAIMLAVAALIPVALAVAPAASGAGLQACGPAGPVTL